MEKFAQGIYEIHDVSQRDYVAVLRFLERGGYFIFDRGAEHAVILDSGKEIGEIRIGQDSKGPIIRATTSDGELETTLAGLQLAEKTERK
jgi:hypothetical protein